MNAECPSLWYAFPLTVLRTEACSSVLFRVVAYLASTPVSQRDFAESRAYPVCYGLRLSGFGGLADMPRLDARSGHSKAGSRGPPGLPGPLTKRRRKPTREEQDRRMVLLMRDLKVREELAHLRARRLERTRPEKAEVLFVLGRQAFDLHQAMKQEWSDANDVGRAKWLQEAHALLVAIDEAL